MDGGQRPTNAKQNRDVDETVTITKQFVSREEFKCYANDSAVVLTY